MERERVTVEIDDGEETIEELTMGDVGEEAVSVSGPNPGAQGSVIVALDPKTGEEISWVTYLTALSNIKADSGYVADYGLGDETAAVFDVLEQEGIIRAGAFAYSITGGAFFANGRYNFRVYDLSAGGENAWEADS